MNCNEVAELIPAVVDGEAGGNVLDSLAKHFEDCPSCREELELQRLTKNVVRRHLSRGAAPSSTGQRVRQAIAAERRTAQLVRTSTVRRFPLGFMWAAGVTLVGAFLFLFISQSNSHHSHSQPVDGNIIHQAYNNFDEVLDGKVKPAIMTDDPESVRAYFRPMLDFDVQVPVMSKYHLIGAVCSQYKNHCIAQLIYKGSKDVVYLYEIGSRTVFNDENGFTMPQQAKADIRQTGWYVENKAPECSLAVWVIDSTLCCALADIRKDLLLASLTEPR